MTNKCKGRNKSNLPCGAPPLPGEDYCAWHCGHPLPLKPFEEALLNIAKKAKNLQSMLRTLLEYKKVLLSPHYQKSEEGQDMVWALGELFNTFRILMSGTERMKEETLRMLKEVKNEMSNL